MKIHSSESQFYQIAGLIASELQTFTSSSIVLKLINADLFKWDLLRGVSSSND